jgi:hypothetical protein
MITNLLTGYPKTRKIQSSSLQFIHGNVLCIFVDDGICNFPDLNEVVFGRAANNPGLIHIPAKVCEVVGMAAMHEETVPRLALDDSH